MTWAFDHLVSIKATLINNLDEGKFSDNFYHEYRKKNATSLKIMKTEYFFLISKSVKIATLYWSVEAGNYPDEGWWIKTSKHGDAKNN